MRHGHHRPHRESEDPTELVSDILAKAAELEQTLSAPGESEQVGEVQVDRGKLIRAFLVSDAVRKSIKLQIFRRGSGAAWEPASFIQVSVHSLPGLARLIVDCLSRAQFELDRDGTREDQEDFRNGLR